jgi:hypothetical protein
MAQIRLHSNTRLCDIVKDLQTGVEIAMAGELKDRYWGLAQKKQLARVIRHRLQEAIQAYSVCGEQPRCHLSIHDTADGHKQLQMNPSAQILILEESLPHLSILLTASIFDRFFPTSPDTVWLKLKPQIDQVIDESFKPVLYDNPYCEHCPRCAPQTLISAWTLKPSAERSRRNS